RFMIRPDERAARNRALTADAAHARKRHHRVPLTMKRAPRKRNARTRDSASGATNCGRNARKNSATFGLSTLVSRPVRNTAQSLALAKTGAVPSAGARSVIIRMPRYVRYAAPASLMKVNACADAARIAARPYAAASVWMAVPQVIANADSTPARRPCDRLR